MELVEETKRKGLKGPGMESCLFCGGLAFRNTSKGKSCNTPMISILNLGGATMSKINQEKHSVLRRRQVEARTGLSRSTIYFYMQKGTFPKPINLGERAVGWLEDEIENWLMQRIENRDSGRDR